MNEFTRDLPRIAAAEHVNGVGMEGVLCGLDVTLCLRYLIIVYPSPGFLI